MERFKLPPKGTDGPLQGLPAEAGKGLTRRQILKGAGMAVLGLSLPTIITTPVRGANAPSNRITVGSIGLGGMGMHHLRALLSEPGFQVVGLCEVDSNRLTAARDVANLPLSQCYRDFRELIARPDIDVIDVSTPDHWHTPMAIAGMRAGKAVYLQKPVSLSIAEGRELVDASRRFNGIVQTGSQQRSERSFRLAAQAVRNGRLGRITSIQVGLEKAYYPVAGVQQPGPPPPHLDYDMWLGPAPFMAYSLERVIHFRGCFDYTGGYFADWGAHHFDIIQWALGMDNSGPVVARGTGTFWTEGIFDVPYEFDVTYEYADGVSVHASLAYENGINFIGERGSIFVSRSRLTASPRSLLTDPYGPGDVILQQSPGHDLDFLLAVREGRDPLVPAEIGHRSATMCHIGNIAMRLGREVRWDPKAEQFIGDDEANRMRFASRRAPWGGIS